MRRKRLALSLLLLIVTAGCLHIGGGESELSPESGVAFASFAPLNTDLFLANADGSEPRPLLPHWTLDYNASFSADGTWIVFTSEREGSSDIYRVRPDGSDLERLIDDPAFDDQGALSPNGRWLAFVSSRSGQADIWILDLADRSLRNLTDHPGGDFRPAWSPDGEWIAFSSDRDSSRPHAGFVTLHSTEIYLIRREGTATRRLTHRGAFVGSPSWSPDGTQLAIYETEIGEVQKITSPRRLRGTTQIATLDVATGARRVLTSGEGEKWSPRWLDESRIVYVTGGPERGVEIAAVDADAGAAPVSTSGYRGEVRSPSWSSDGRRVVFHREVEKDWPPHRVVHSRDPRYRLVRTGVFAAYSPRGDQLVLNDGAAAIVHNRVLRMDADGTRRSVLFVDSLRSALAPTWSPQGNRIAVALGRFFPNRLGPAAAAIAIMCADGSGLTLITDSTGNAGFPSWSPDGRQLVYRMAKEGRSALMIVDVETRAVRALTAESGNDNSPAWSPRGDRIAFTARRGGEADYDLFTIRPDGTDLQRLTNAPGNDSHPAWSPDGTWIVFTSARGGFKDEAVLHPFNPQPYGDLYAMHADGAEIRMLTDNQFEDGTPAWIPSGSRSPSRDIHREDDCRMPPAAPVVK